MKHSLLSLGLLAALGLGRAQAQTAAAGPRLVVRLLTDENAEAGNQPGSPTQALEKVNRQHRALQMQALNPGQPRANGPAPAPAVYLITLPAGIDAQRALLEYQQTGLFRYVELDATGQGGGVQGVVPNDAQYARQWSLANNGTFSLSPARAGADIKMEDAWAVTRGDSSVTVAIIDTGCKLDHPEFDRRIWRNRREIPANGLDDDQNGYVDDVQGWNFVANNNNPADDYGHGTNVTGIVGATGNNAVGYAGVNWGCKLMICKGLNAQNSGFYSSWTAGIYYAVNNGARVINMSLGGTSPSQAMQDAVSFATQRGVTVVACMMNTNNSVTYYPAGLTGVIAVGSTNPNDTRSSPFFWDAASGSNYGAHLSVVAPGNYIYGLNYQSNTNFNSYWGGTSQAAPHVAGLVSLLLTMRPGLTPGQIRTTLQTTADDRVGNPQEDLVGWDQYYGHGRVNAARALATMVVTATQGPRIAPSALQLFPNPALHQLTLRATDPQLLRRDVQIFNTLGQQVYQQALTEPLQQLELSLPPGTYWLAVAGTGVGHRLVVQ